MIDRSSISVTIECSTVPHLECLWLDCYSITKKERILIRSFQLLAVVGEVAQPIWLLQQKIGYSHDAECVCVTESVMEASQ